MLTHIPPQKRNFIFLWLRDAMIILSNSLTSTSVLSAFFLEIGLSNQQISNYLAVVPMVNLIISMIFSGITEKTGAVIKGVTLLCGITGVLNALFSLFCIFRWQANIMYFGIIILGSLLSAAVALRTVYEYKVPCEVITKAQYSTYQGYAGIIGSIFGIAAGLAVSALYRYFPVIPTSTGIFLAAGVFLFIGGWSNQSLTILYPTEKKDPSKKSNMLSAIWAVLSDRDYLWMIVPNLIRGISSGAVGIIPVLSASVLELTGSEITLITVCSYGANLLGCWIYSQLSKKIGAPLTGLLSAIVFCMIIPSLQGGKILFYILYFISYVGNIITQYVIPEIIFRNVSSQKISAFQTWRMVLTTLGTSISTALIGFLTGKVAPWIMLAVGAISLFFTMVCYYAYYEKRMKPEHAKQ